MTDHHDGNPHEQDLEQRLTSAFAETGAPAMPTALASAVGRRRTVRRVQSVATGTAVVALLATAFWVALPAPPVVVTPRADVHAWSLAGLRLSGDVLPDSPPPAPTAPQETQPSALGIAWDDLPGAWSSDG